MSKVTTLFAPVVPTITPPAGALSLGKAVTIDANIAARILYTLDGSLPEEDEFGTIEAEAPVTIYPAFSCTIRYRAIALDQDDNYSKTKSAVFTVARNNPAEIFRDGKHFHRRLLDVTVDDNFFTYAKSWTVPKSSTPYTYLVRNPETIPVRVRLLHNGVDTRAGLPYPTLQPGAATEFGMVVSATSNLVEIQTQESITV